MIKRDKVIYVRVTEAEKSHIEFNAKIAGVSVSKYMRLRGEFAEIEAKPPVGSNEIIQQLIDIGRNINQIARNTNMGEPVTDRLLAEVKRQHDEALRIVKEL